MEEEDPTKNSGADSSLTISSSFSNALCIFCAAVCPASFTILNGKIIRIKEEVEDNEEEETPRPSVEDEILERQLRSIFIVRNILDVSASTCSKYLKEFEGQLDPEYWVNICSECKSPVYEYYQTVMEINKLEVKMKNIKIKLKELITNSFEGSGENGAAEGVTTTIWRVFREESIKGTNSNVDEDKHSEQYFDAKEEPESFSSSTMEVDCDITSMVKVEMDISTASEDVEAHEIVTECIPPMITNGRRQSPRKNSKTESIRSVKVEKKTVKSKKTEKLQPQPSSSSSHDVNPTLNGLSTQSQSSASSSSSKPLIFYKCEECNALVESQTKRLRSHENLHKSEGKGKQCKQCGWLVTYMNVHLKTWHSGKTEKMLKGNVIIRPMSQRKKDRSVLRVTESNPNFLICRQFGKSIYKCRHCPGMSFGDRKFIEEHSKLHNEGKGTPCDACGWLIAEGRMGRHMAKRHNNRNLASFIEPLVPVVKLEDGNETAESVLSQSLPQVVPRPIPGLPRLFHRCEECGEGFKTRRRLRNHLQLHNSLTFQESLVVASPSPPTRLTLDVKSFTCNHCEMTFYKKCGLTTHVNVRHKLKKLPDAKEGENEGTESTNPQPTDKTDPDVNGVTEDEVATAESTNEIPPGSESEGVSEPKKEIVSESTSDFASGLTSEVISGSTSEVIPEPTREVTSESTSEVTKASENVVVPNGDVNNLNVSLES